MPALFLFVLTLGLVIWQPRGLGIGWSAGLGAGLALLTGVIRLEDIPVVWGIVWNATGTFIAVVIITGVGALGGALNTKFNDIKTKVAAAGT